jgi:YebC/PmpR family DNA-binding regulatory protein
MSGHSKWHSIKHKKGAADAKRGKIFTKHAKLITIAAKNGPDPDMNAALRTAIDNAKAENVPNSNIERAIKKGSGTGKDAIQMFETSYEAYGPAGVAIYITAITDNKNRTLTNVRTILGKNGGNLGNAGSVAYLFHHKAHFVIDPEAKDIEELELEILEFEIEDITVEDGKLDIVAEASNFTTLRKKFDEAGYTLETSELTYLPENTSLIEDASKAKSILSLIEKLEEDDDVSDVYANFEFSDAILDELA